MTNFLQPDHFAHISTEQIEILKEASDAEVKAFYIADTQANYAESFWLDIKDVTGLVVNIADGTAEGNGREYSGRPSLAEFIEYLEKGRNL